MWVNRLQVTFVSIGGDFGIALICFAARYPAYFGFAFPNLVVDVVGGCLGTVYVVYHFLTPIGATGAGADDRNISATS